MNSNVLITGASSGIGRALAYKFSSNVKSLVLCSRNEEGLVKVKERVEKKELKVHVFPCDLSSEKNCIRLSDFAVSKNVNVLINNAAIPSPGISLNNISVSQISDIINVNLKAPIFLSKLIKGLNTIINLNSMLGLEHKFNRTIYSASKWGLRGFSESLKLEMDAVVLDVYLSNVKTRPDIREGQEVNFVANQIYEAYLLKKTELILDGRPR